MPLEYTRWSPAWKRISCWVLELLENLFIRYPIYGLLYLLYVFFKPFILLSDARTVSRMRSAGRYLVWDEARQRLAQGRGTLIFSDMNGLPRCGSMRHDFGWWVEEDLVAGSPEPLPDRFAFNYENEEGVQEQYFANSLYAQRCADLYLDPKRGPASLVKVPYDWMLEEESKRVSVVCIEHWDDFIAGPQVARGTTLAVFDFPNLHGLCHAEAKRKGKPKH